MISFRRWIGNDPFADQENTFKNDVNDNVKNVHGAIKSDNQPKQVAMKSQDSYNKLKDDPVTILGAISGDNSDDNIKNAQESNQSDENRKQKYWTNMAGRLNIIVSMISSQEVTRKLYTVFRIEENCKYCFIKLVYSNLFAKIHFKINK